MSNPRVFFVYKNLFLGQDSSYELMDEAEISFAASLIASQGVLAD